MTRHPYIHASILLLSTACGDPKVLGDDTPADAEEQEDVDRMGDATEDAPESDEESSEGDEDSEDDDDLGGDDDSEGDEDESDSEDFEGDDDAETGDDSEDVEDDDAVGDDSEDVEDDDAVGDDEVEDEDIDTEEEGDSSGGGSGDDSAGTTIVVTPSGLPTALPPSGSSGTLTTLSGEVPSGTIADIDFSIDLDHTCTKDLSAILESPTGTTVVLFDLGAMPVCSSDMVETVLDDEAVRPITSGSSPFTGYHRPLGALSDFDGEDTAGIWSLQITDSTIGDVGTLYSWSLKIVVD